MNTTTQTINLEQVVTALNERNFNAVVVNDRAEALEKIKLLIPKGASVMNGTSKTLEEIGYIDYLKSGRHGWNNLHEAILNEPDEEKQALLRRQSVVSDFYLGSVHALAATGELVIASNSGSQLPHIAYTSPNLIFVVSTKKIVPNLQMAFERLEKHVVPLESERIKSLYGVPTTHAKTLIFHRENPSMGRNVKIILVNEPLGF